MSRVRPAGGSHPLKLDITIPAYNEEAAVGAIIRRCLDARQDIIASTPVSEVAITLVSDGSHDRTVEIARTFEPEIQVVAYEKNRGCGGAIKAGFTAGDGDLVAFLDADGTCDPRFFVQMTNALVEQDAHLCIGSRMGPDSKMPRLRRVGNRMWRSLINWIAQTSITDAASGMRVLRRDALPMLDPLPDGMHYTPTMSCRASLDARIKMVEIPMAYKERVGRSKLNVVRDGLRFLQTIIDVGLTYQPFRLISVPGFALFMIATVLLVPAAVHYVEFRRVEEGQIYRILTVVVAATAGLQMFLAGLTGERVVDMTHPKKWHGGWLLAWLKTNLAERPLLLASAVCLLAAIALNARGLYTYATGRFVLQHWSHVAIGGLLTLVGFQCLAAAILDRALRLLGDCPGACKPNP